MIKLSEINLMTAEGRLLAAAIDHLVDVRNMSDSHATTTRHQVFDELIQEPSVVFAETVFGPVKASDPHVADINVTEDQAVILLRMADIRRIGPVGGRPGDPQATWIRFDSHRKGKFQSVDIPFRDGVVKLHFIIFLIARTWEGWGKAFAEKPGPDFAREIAFRSRLATPPRYASTAVSGSYSSQDHHFFDEGYTDDFFARLRDYIEGKIPVDVKSPAE